MIVEHRKTSEDSFWVFGETLHDGAVATTWQRLKTDAEVASDRLFALRRDRSPSEPRSEEEEALWQIVLKDRTAIRRSPAPI